MADTPPPPPPPPTVLLPLKLDAFTLNPAVTTHNPHQALIAPITQPNYTFLRLDSAVIQPDILPATDLHTAGISDVTGRNPRLYDLGANTLRENRVGVYITWLVPRVYRSGAASTAKPGDKDPPNADNSAPAFREAPVRWLVVRVVDKESIEPEEARNKLPLCKAWVVESDRYRTLDELDETVDLQTDVSPFINPGPNMPTEGPNGGDDIPGIETQAEVFIGYRKDAAEWAEDKTAKRVPMCLVNSANPLFADFQPHNGNVFSMCDNFEYDGGTATAATASYYVIGWHSDEKMDLFYADDTMGTPPLHQALLSQLNMEFSKSSAEDVAVQDFLKSSETARLLCHGALYNINWDAKRKPPNIPADTQSALLAEKMPVAVGTTPIDALLAYVAAHKDSASGEIAELEKDLYALQGLLQAQDGTVDGVRQAADELSAGNYVRSATGTHYHFAVTGDATTPPVTPTEDDITDLRILNQCQYALDNASMMLSRKRWELFAVWWDYVGDIDKAQNQRKYTETAMKLNNDITGLIKLMSGLEKDIQDKKNRKGFPPLKAAVTPSAFQTRDPTLVVGGVESGWPADYLNKLMVRLDSEIIAEVSAPETPSPPMPETWDDFKKILMGKFPTELQGAAGGLLGEFALLRDNDSNVPPTMPNQVYPLYHDTGAPDTVPGPWRDRWNSTQPWFPLFLEWEAEYTHIPFEYWLLESCTTRPQKDPQLRYGISSDKPLFEKGLNDTRTVSGRVLILPQPNFSLATKLQQVYDSTPDNVLEAIPITREEFKKLMANLWRLPFLSAPLSGLTDHLLTMVQGTHIKPLVRRPKQKPAPLPEAVQAAAKIGFTPELMGLIDKETDLTPYGTLVQFLDSDYCAFKPVTHGQLRFTQLNIIDKFGQAISGIDPSIQPPPPLYPAISDFYSPQLLTDGTNRANTVVEDTPGYCEFIQLPPSINQPARLTPSFVVQDGPDHKGDWRPAAEWENPIWGWIVINYPDHGLQLFTSDGTFYREVRLGGQRGTAAVPGWLPFEPPKSSETPSRLELLVQQLRDHDYLKAFMSMISQSLRKAPAAPSAYAEFLAAIIGKPLALTTMGWSLELSTDALTQQSTLNTAQPEMWLLPSGTDKKRKIYNFPIKLGDADRSYDGLIGYFLPTPADRTVFDLSKIHTFFGEGDAIESIDGVGKYPTFAPFWSDPTKMTPTQLDAERNKHMSVFGAIVDPFTSVHGYSSFLPPVALTLPPWTWQGAISTMTAFFRIGPLMMTGDVPEYETYREQYQLKEGYNLATDGVVPGSGVGVPVGVADWAWLQPYVGEGNEGEGYLPLGVAKGDARPRFEMGPYTAVEGYLQLRGPVVGKAPVPPGKS